MPVSCDETGNPKKGKTFFEELNAFIIETRRSQMEEAAMSISRLNLIKKSKGETLLNRPNFLKKFGCFDSIMRLKELDLFRKDPKLFSKEFKKKEAD